MSALLRSEEKRSITAHVFLWGMPFVLAALLSVNVNAQAEPIPELPEISEEVAAADPDLVRQRAELVNERNALRDRVARHNDVCEKEGVEEGSAAEAACIRSYQDISAAVGDHIEASKKYLKAYRAAVAASKTCCATPSLYIDNLIPDLEAAYKDWDEAEKNIAKINAYRERLSLPKDAYADAKAIADLMAAQEMLRKIEDNIAHLKKAILKAEEDMRKSMGALAKRLNWSDEEQARLVKALKDLDFEGDPSATVAKKRQTWQAMLTEGRGGIRLEAAKGDGPSLQWTGAGEQTIYNDCTIFAMANASGVPYGVVAGMAAELVRQGDWHAPAIRNNPQELMEKSGLNGGEVIMLAESLGQAEVVRSADFPKVLKDGRPVLVNVASQNGSGGHQVVLTKTFHYKGKTWYEMMDSTQGPQKRLYLSAGELDIILQENGTAFRPEPMLLR